MNRKAALVATFLIAALAGHLGLVLATPHVLMRGAMKKLSGPDAKVNGFVFGPRTTSASRNVVRSSPDLAYSSCVFDLSKGPLRIEAAPTADGGYASISIFAANTDNIAVFDTSQFPAGIRFVLARKGDAARPGERMVFSPTDKGIILDRRLAPNARLFALADQARRQGICAPVSGAGKSRG